MRSSLHLITLALALTACSSGDAGTADDGGPDAAAPNQFDACAYFPKEVADLVLGGAAHDSLRASEGSMCTWHGVGEWDLATVRIYRSGINPEVFGQVCAAAELPVIDNRGIGIAACGRFDPGFRMLFVQFDETTTSLMVSSTVGSLDQGFEVLRAVAGRLNAP